MPKYIVFWDTNYCGTKCHSDIEEFDNEEEAIRAFEDEAYEWASQFEETYGDEEEEFDGGPEYSIWVEEYDPKKHDRLF
jgi:uncharacterized protein YabN with tetrapyrrole methylase and pyrophosphatase domain